MSTCVYKIFDAGTTLRGPLCGVRANLSKWDLVVVPLMLTLEYCSLTADTCLQPTSIFLWIMCVNVIYQQGNTTMEPNPSTLFLQVLKYIFCYGLAH